MARVLVPVHRTVRWVENFVARHGATSFSVDGGALHGDAEDGSTFTARLPFGAAYEGPADISAFQQAVRTPASWGILLVRKGGFAVAHLNGDEMVEHKVGQRHVQGRTKAGGQSQQRFARRRSNQARQAYEAAAGHAARILSPGPLVVGGDRGAVEQVMAGPGMPGLEVVGEWLDVPDPRRQVLDQAVLDAQAVGFDVRNAGEDVR